MRRVDIEVPKLGERPHGTSVGPPPNPKRSQGGGDTEDKSNSYDTFQ